MWYLNCRQVENKNVGDAWHSLQIAFEEVSNSGEALVYGVLDAYLSWSSALIAELRQRGLNRAEKEEKQVALPNNDNASYPIS